MGHPDGSIRSGPTHGSGDGPASGLMRLRLDWMLVSLAIGLSACQGDTRPSPLASARVQPSVSPRASPALSEADLEAVLHDFSYLPSPGTPGGSVMIGRRFATAHLTPYLGGHDVLAATMPTLLTVSSDGHWMPRLSEGPITYSDSVEEDGSGSSGFTVHVRIGPDLKWSDGEPMTLDDLKYTWEAVREAGRVGIPPLGWDKVDRIDVLADGREADIHFAERYGGWLGVVGASTILPEHYLKAFPLEDWAEAYPLSPALGDAVTLGPFKYASAGEDRIELVRDDNWAGPAEACGGLACLERVTFRFFHQDVEGEIAAFLNGELDVALGLFQGVDDSALRDLDPAFASLVVEPPDWRYEHLDFNQAGLGQGRGHPALRDLVVREAIAQSIDKKAMWEAVFPGAVRPDDDPCTPATPTNYWRLPNAPCLPFDVNAANTALDAAGYTRGSDGVRVDPGSNTPLVFEHCTLPMGWRELGGEFLEKAVMAIGIELNVHAGDALFAPWQEVRADTTCNLARGTYDTAHYSYILGMDLFGNYYYSYHSEQIPTEANGGTGLNFLRLADPEMDAALEALESAVAPGEQLQAAYTVQRIYSDQVPEVPLFYQITSIPVRARVQNFAKNSAEMWNVQDWWVTR